jgi:hypothetical protein
MPSDLRSIDLVTLNIVREVVVTALRNHVCQWEQQSADAVSDGRLSNAVMLKNWSFAGDLLAGVVSTEISGLLSKSLNARLGDLSATSHRSVADQILDAIALEVASAQEAPELAPF